MIEQHPLVSIGLPVYNGEKYLENALDSILAQTFNNFELIISDNASKDNTEEICRKYTLKDERIRYHRNPQNIGGFNNHNLTFSLANGDYFHFAAYDDIWAPDLLSKCVEALDKHPEVILSYTKTVQIDANGQFIRVISQQKGTSTAPYKRFQDLTGFDHDCEPIYGLIRSDILNDIDRKTGILLSYTDSDRTLLCQLSLYGPFFQIPEPLFYRRIHPASSTKVYPEWRKRMLWAFPEGVDPITFPHWQQFFHYLRVIITAPISMRERGYCYRHIFHWVLMDRRWRKMLKDLYLASKKFYLYSRSKAVS
jgi:glycosyltransferase involved in cell wall biosynthesis